MESRVEDSYKVNRGRPGPRPELEGLVKISPPPKPAIRTGFEKAGKPPARLLKKYLPGSKLLDQAEAPVGLGLARLGLGRAGGRLHAL